MEAARRSAEEQRVVAHFLSLVPLSSKDAIVEALAESLDFTIDSPDGTKTAVEA